MVGAPPAQALNLPGIFEQGRSTAAGTLFRGTADTVESFARYGAAHAYLAGDPESRYIVVLGARVNEDGTLPEVLNARLDAAAAIARAHPSTGVIVSGGPTQAVPYSEGQAMLAGLTLRGVNPANISVEDRSFSTVDNARNTVDILESRGADGAVIVSSDSHMERAAATFQNDAPDLRYILAGVDGW